MSFDTRKIAAQIVPWLCKHGTDVESNLVIGADPYKQVYRAMSLMFVAGFSKLEGLEQDYVPTLGEVRATLRQAHPFFEHIVEVRPDWIISMYEFFEAAYS